MLIFALLPALASGLAVGWSVSPTGEYSVTIDSAPWLSSPSFAAAPPSLCVGGVALPLALAGAPAAAAGTDALGDWTGTTYTLTAAGAAPPVAVTHTFKSYAANPQVIVATAAFPSGVPAGGAGPCPGAVRTAFPQFNTSDAMAPSLGVFSWRGAALSDLPSAVGLAGLGADSLDSGPVVAFFRGRPGVPHPGLVWSTLDAHKIVRQATSAAAASDQPAPAAALWSAQRSEQVLCLTAECAQLQVADGNYTPARVEGWGYAALATPGSVCVGGGGGGSRAPTVALSVAWAAARLDNCVAPAGAPAPGSGYATMCDNGHILAPATAGSVPGTLPLYAYNRTYTGTHWDYAAVASAEGVAWAEGAGYTRGVLLGYVHAAQPAPCSGGGGGGNSSSGTYTLGLTAEVPAIPAGWEYSTIFSLADGGPTAAVYQYGEVMRGYYGTTRLPSVTLTDIGYYTDDGAYYYVWEAFNIPARPFSAEDGLVLVKEDLYAKGIPVAYMQLDDWWYQGKFFFGNVKSVTDWHASNATRLFPNGLPRFSDRLGLPLQLYTPFFADDFQTPYNMTESTAFKGTKLVVPAQSYAFFSDLFDLGLEQTGGRMKAYEVDFLDSNFEGSASMFETVHSADEWYGGMAQAALERGIAIQYCLCSPTDILQALTLPSVVQARASGDYVNKVDNPLALGGSSLLMGALHIAPSKDTLWTASPQPGTMSDTEHDGLSYTTQPHVALDAVLATLSLGPVGISDGLGQADAGLISQAFRSANDSTLLRPSRPLSWVDSSLLNRTFGGAFADVRSTHAAVRATSASAGAPTRNSHYVLSWRTPADVVLGATDLYPAPADPSAPLAARLHVLAPGAGAAQGGCVEGAPAVPGCVTLVNYGEALVAPASGVGLGNFTLLAVYEPLESGAWFLGELAKFVHVSPQRFDYVAVGGGGASGVAVGVRGSQGESVLLTSVDAKGVVHVQSVDIPEGGYVEAQL